VVNQRIVNGGVPIVNVERAVGRSVPAHARLTSTGPTRRGEARRGRRSRGLPSFGAIHGERRGPAAAGGKDPRGGRALSRTPPGASPDLARRLLRWKGEERDTSRRTWSEWRTREAPKRIRTQ
jgi:hypothetical protein